MHTEKRWNYRELWPCSPLPQGRPISYSLSHGNWKACAFRGLTSDILPCYMQRWPNIAKIHSSHQQVKAAYPSHLLKEPRPPPGPKPGDFIYLTSHQRKATLELHWKGPYQVLFTDSIVKLQGVNPWLHVSQLQK